MSFICQPVVQASQASATHQSHQAGSEKVQIFSNKPQVQGCIGKDPVIDEVVITDVILLEDGGFWLLEDGGYWLQETGA